MIIKSLLISLTLPFTSPQNSIFREFPHPCKSAEDTSCDNYGSGYECCKFEDGTGLMVWKCIGDD